jgi:hypothetical protein
MARFREGTGTSLVVAIGSVGLFSIFAWLAAVLLWAALAVYAVVEMIGDGRPSALAVLLTLAILVATITILIAVAIGFVGKRLVPPRRKRP